MVFIQRDLVLIKQTAIDCGLEYIQHTTKDNWVAAQFVKDKQMKKIIIILCLSLLVNSVMGQAKKRLRVFTEESGTYLEELSDFMLASPSEDGKKLMKEFSKMWKGETFSSDKKQTIYDISNIMLKERKRPTHF